jgi:transcription factor SFP1
MPAPVDIRIKHRDSFHTDSNSFSMSYTWSNSFRAESAFMDMDPPNHFDTLNTTESPFLPHVEQNILRDFSCCGVELSDLHALIRHYEDKHAGPFIDDDDMAMDLDGYEGDSTPTFQGAREKPDIAELKRRAKFTMVQGLARSNSVFDFELDIKTPKRTASFPSPALPGRDSMFEQYGSQWSSSQSSPIETPEQSFPSTPVTLPLHDLDVHVPKEWPGKDWSQFPINYGSQPQTIRKSRQPNHQENPSVVSPENTIVVDKPYKCKNLGCDKAYKNMNGLKYHRMHGVCNKNNLSHTDLGSASPAPQTPPASVVSTPAPSVPSSPALPLHTSFSNPITEEKKYSCEKCTKRYKNLNGLKYHKKATHKSAEDISASPFSLTTGMSFAKLR